MTIITSLYPKDEKRPLATSEVIHLFAAALDATRVNGNTFEGALTDVIDKLSLELPETAAVLATDIFELIKNDDQYDSEYAQAFRATKTTLTPLLPGTVQACGWLRGETITIQHERFQLTGDACPTCDVNPEAYGTGGGTRCIDVHGCGWWYCA